MSPALRNQLKAELDRRKRAELQAEIDSGMVRACSGCGCHSHLITPGCAGCWDRRRWRNATPERRTQLIAAGSRRRRQLREAARRYRERQAA